jgi:hypothetical protein
VLHEFQLLWRSAWVQHHIVALKLHRDAALFLTAAPGGNFIPGSIFDSAPFIERKIVPERGSPIRDQGTVQGGRWSSVRPDAHFYALCDRKKAGEC